MQEHPILFSTSMVEAILDGRKTQIRRVIKDNLLSRFDDLNLDNYSDRNPSYETECGQLVLMTDLCPYGQVGDRLWVRETFCYYQSIKDEQGNPKVAYKADIYDSGLESFKWKPSIFMPRKVSRILLEITDIRVERLQDVSEEDAVKEGCTKRLYPCSAFKKLWDSINAKNHTWDSNPYVWVIEFKMIN